MKAAVFHRRPVADRRRLQYSGGRGAGHELFQRLRAVEHTPGRGADDVRAAGVGEQQIALRCHRCVEGQLALAHQLRGARRANTQQFDAEAATTRDRVSADAPLAERLRQIARGEGIVGAIAVRDDNAVRQRHPSAAHDFTRQWNEWKRGRLSGDRGCDSSAEQERDNETHAEMCHSAPLN